MSTARIESETDAGVAPSTPGAGDPRDPQRKLATLFGAVLVALGVVDASGVLSNEDGHLLGVFRIPPSISAIHVLTGLLGLFLARYAGGATLFNKVGSVIYLVVTLGGALGTLTGRAGVDWETNAFHLLLAAVVGWVGFEGGKRRPT